MTKKKKLTLKDLTQSASPSGEVEVTAEPIVIQPVEEEGIPYEIVSREGVEAHRATFDDKLKDAYLAGKSMPKSTWRTIKFNMDVSDPIKADANFQKLFYKENRDSGVLKSLEFLQSITADKVGWPKGAVVRLPAPVAEYFVSQKYYIGGGFEHIKGPKEMNIDEAQIVKRYRHMASYVD